MGKTHLNKLTKEERLALRVKTLATLKANGGNIAKTMRETGVCRPTILSWVNANDEATRKLKEERKQQKAQQKEELKQKRETAEAEQARIAAEEVEKVVKLSESKLVELVNGIVESLIKDYPTAKFYDRAWCGGVMFDKIQILQGNPTSISANVIPRTKRERAERTKELLETAHQRRQAMKLVPQVGTNGHKKNGTHG